MDDIKTGDWTIREDQFDNQYLPFAYGVWDADDKLIAAFTTLEAASAFTYCAPVFNINYDREHGLPSCGLPLDKGDLRCGEWVGNGVARHADRTGCERADQRAFEERTRRFNAEKAAQAEMDRAFEAQEAAFDHSERWDG